MISNKRAYRVETRPKEAIWMRRTTATTDYLKESMGTALLELLDSALPSGINNQRQPNGRVLTFPPVSALEPPG